MQATTSLLSIVNAHNWSWGIASASLFGAMRYRYNVVRICRKPKEAVEQDLIDFFDVTLMQNADNLGLIKRNQRKIVTRMGGMVIDECSMRSRYDHWLSKCGAVISTNRQLHAISSRVNPNCCLAPNPIDLEHFKVKPHEQLWPQRKLNDAKAMFTVGFAGNVWNMGADYKGWKYYSQAVINMMTEVKKIECLHQGPASQRQIPHDRMVQDFYHMIDCLILPSLNEGCSNVVGEALACGIPVLCTKVGYHGDMLTHGENVLFVIRDADDIVKKTRMLRARDDLYNRISQNGRKFVEQHQNLDDIAALYDRVLRSVWDRAQA